MNRNRSFAALFLTLALAYGSWLLIFWPGILGEDSLAIIQHVMEPETHHSGKPAFWFYFVGFLYKNLQLAEIPILLIIFISILIQARILSWCWFQGMHKTAIFLLSFICLAPHFIFFSSSLYPDGIYSIATVGLLFEIWLAAKNKKISIAALSIIFITLPFASFARPNGIIFLAPTFFLLFLVDRRSRNLLGTLLLAWCGLMVAGSNARFFYSHGTIFPLAIHETVGFLQPRAMDLARDNPRISPDTIIALEKHRPLETYIKGYDPDYWDTLTFKPDGPQVMKMDKAERRVIIKEFIRYNLWQNFPKFLGSRVNIFMTSALADGGLPSLSYSERILQSTGSQSIYRKFQLKILENFATQVFNFSYRYRWIFWTPFLGIALLFWAARVGFQEKDKALLLVAIPMLAQVGGIFAFSIAGEYRYLLPFFLLPLILLPVLLGRRSAPGQTAQHRQSTPEQLGYPPASAEAGVP
ncbi:hypothetical protein DelCs14_0661 [Delftia sp. Cs1-4]|uniref:hypothetical protein n=1 Tax=Delftia sp. (strain Cs1-4) TaxID=742013 RepID=UPI00020E7D56|nr:hypothetical protein [Delftia sp. Cs1-4]AEF87699.1 hypothetical protein DelCs14_0661 [Delftia sp. Cs1-4]